jgi:hypothetical protein
MDDQNNQYHTTPWQNNQSNNGGFEVSCTCWPRMTMSGSWWNQKKDLDPVSLQKRYDDNRERRQKKMLDASNADSEQNASAAKSATNGENAEVASDDGSIVIVKVSHE